MSGAAAAAALIASGFAAASRTTNWHNQNKEKFKQRKKDLAEKYKSRLSEEEAELVMNINKQVKLDNLKVSKKPCPECKRKLSIIHVLDVELDCCQFCHSFWFDSGELKLLTGLKKDVVSEGMKTRASKYECPICDKPMKETVFKASHNLLVDQCEEHGVYLENNELNRVVEII